MGLSSTSTGSLIKISGGNSWNEAGSPALAASGTLIGIGERSEHPDVMIAAKVEGGDATLYVEFSWDDGVNYDTSIPVELFDGVSKFETYVKGDRTFRLRLVAGDDALTAIRITAQLGVFARPAKSLKSTIAADSGAVLTRTDDELAVMRGRVSGEYIISKFGQNTDVDGAEDIWDGGGLFTGFPTTAAEEFQIVCASTDDDNEGTGAQAVRLYYLNDNYEIFDENGDFLYVDVATNGNDGGSGTTDSGVTGMRIWRAKVITSGSGQTNAGTITVRWITTTSVVFTVIQAGSGQSEITAFTIPDGYTGWLKRYSSEMTDSNNNRANMAIKVRDFGSNTFRLIRPYIVARDVATSFNLYGGQQFAEKTDFVFRCTAVANANAVISTSWAVHLSRN